MSVNVGCADFTSCIELRCFPSRPIVLFSTLGQKDRLATARSQARAHKDAEISLSGRLRRTKLYRRPVNSVLRLGKDSVAWPFQGIDARHVNL